MNFEHYYCVVFIKHKAAAHKVSQRARCHNCGIKGNYTYQIVYTGYSDVARDGAGVKSNNYRWAYQS